MRKGLSTGPALLCLAAVGGLLVIMLAPALSSSGVLHGRMLSVHLVLELFAITIAVLVVTVSWHSFGERKDASSNALVAGFVVVACCDLLHALTYQGMPDFVTESSTPRAIFFWLMGRTAEVATLGVIALDIVPRVSRAVSLTSGSGLSLAIIGIGSYALDAFPITFVDGVGVTPFKAGCEYTLCGLNLALALLLWRRAVREQERPFMLLALASVVTGIGELSFTAYVAPSDFQNIAGHVYKLAAYTLLYRATFITSLKAPYEALRQSESAERESRARMATLGANLPQAVVYQVVRERDGRMRFTQVADAIERINGLKAADVRRDSMLWYGQIHPEDLPALVAAEQRSAETLQVFDCTARMRIADGRIRRMHLISAPRPLDDGRIVWDGIQTDVTERAEAEDAHRVLEAQLREAQKMESIGTLASGIAHDFNNVLGAILGNASMAREDVRRGASDDAVQALDQVCKAAQRARGLVRQILTFSRRDIPERVVRPLGPIVEESVALLRSTLPAGVEVVAQVDGAPALARVDRTQVEQVILNLCTNAWHALGDKGGRIVVGLGVAPVTGDAAVASALIPGDHAHLWVQDNGCGMDEATRQRVFEPFFTTKPVGQGTGLGLSVVHGIVRAHDGAVTLASSPGRGARFDIYFPLVTPLPSEHDAAPTVPAALHGLGLGRGERVLYVDDDEVMSVMVERLLQRANYRVTCLRDPRHAIELLEQAPDSFDVLVTDYNMPTLSGLDVIRALGAVRRAPPAVLTSGFVGEDLRAEARRLGVVEVLEKEHALEELAPAIERALAGVNASR